jgi:hypothetical protein
MGQSGFTSSAFWISLVGLGVSAYLQSALASFAVGAIVISYNVSNAWVKK